MSKSLIPRPQQCQNPLHVRALTATSQTVWLTSCPRAVCLSCQLTPPSLTVALLSKGFGASSLLQLAPSQLMSALSPQAAAVSPDMTQRQSTAETVSSSTHRLLSGVNSESSFSGLTHAPSVTVSAVDTGPRQTALVQLPMLVKETAIGGTSKACDAAAMPHVAAWAAWFLLTMAQTHRSISVA